MSPKDAQGPEAVVAGHICLDVIPAFEGGERNLAEVLAPGRLVRVGRAVTATGGGVANTGLALHKLGIKATLMGKIGDDMFGRAILDALAGHGASLAQGMVTAPGEASSYSIVLSPPGVDRIFLHHPGANDTFGAEDVDTAVLAKARLFHFGYPPLMRRMYERDGQVLAKVFQRAKSTGVATSLDMALPDPASQAGKADWAKILKKTLPFVDVFLPSVEEILYMLRRGDYLALREQAGSPDILPLVTSNMVAELGQELLDMGVAVAGVKLGERGLYVHTAGSAALESMGRARPKDSSAWADKEVWAPCFKVRLVGATGAGDSAIAGFLSGLLRGRGLEQSASLAAAVGACNVEAADAFSGLLSWEATWDRMARGWERVDPKIGSSDWEECQGLWQRRIRT